MPSTIDLLSWQTLTSAINEIQSPRQFLRRLLFNNHVSLVTETIEVSYYVGGRQIAPFVRKNGQSIMVGGLSQKFAIVEAPNIRISRPFTASQLLSQRMPGFGIFASGADIQNAANISVANDLQFMADMIVNSEEYLCSMALQGVVTYSVADEEVFTITYGRTGTHVVTLSTFWDDADPAAPTIEEDFITAKRLISNDAGLTPTDVILGSEAAAQFRRVMKKQGATLLDISGLTVGSATFASNFTEDGAMYIGTIGGVRVWEYASTILVNGVATDLIRPKYAEFVCATPAAENIMYFGAIPDFGNGGSNMLHVGERFSKSWVEQDPSLLMHLSHARPLPVPRRPDSTVSMKVVSG